MNKKYFKIFVFNLLLFVFFLHAPKLMSQTYGLKFRGHDQAKATYEKFFKEYFKMYNQEYKKSFVDIINSNE